MSVFSGGVSGDLKGRLSSLSYQQVLDGVEDAVIVDDVDGRLVYANRAFFELFGFEERELESIALEDYIAPEWRLRLRDRHDRRMRGEDVPSTFEYEGITADGRRIWLHVSVLAVSDDGTLVGTQSTIRDVTAQKRTEALLRAENRTLADLVDNLPLPICVLSPGGEVQTWNAAAEALFGWTAEELLGAPYPLAPEALAAEHLALLRASIREGVTNEGLETTRRHKDGRMIDIAVWSAPLRDDEGEIFASLAVMRDLTALKQLEEELAHAQKMDALGQLAGGIAHDFNNLLTSILGSAASLRESLVEPKEQVECVEEILASARRGTRLVGQLLMFSRKQVVRPTRVDVDEMVRGLVRWLERLLEDNVVLRLELEATGCEVYADPVQLEQVVVNLVLNARDAMPDGGVLTISTEVSHGSPHDLPLMDYVRLRVRDTGTGMSDETLARAFTPFFTTKEPGKGTGLGLATAYSVVIDTGGAIVAESEIGRGTTLDVHLPVSGSEPVQRLTRVSEAPVPEVAGGSILLVEDDPSVRSTVRRILRRAGYDVVEAPDGETAEGLFRGNPDGFDLLLTDISMPGVSGPELAGRLRALHPKLPVLMMSGFVGDPHHAVSGIEGASFVQKPFEPRALLAKVAKMTSG